MESLILYIPLLLLISSLITGFSSKFLNNFSSGIVSTFLVFISLILSLIILFDIYSSDESIYYLSLIHI